MIEAQQWMVTVLFDDINRLVTGLVILLLLVEIIVKVKGWLNF